MVIPHMHEKTAHTFCPLSMADTQNIEHGVNDITLQVFEEHVGSLTSLLGRYYVQWN